MTGRSTISGRPGVFHACRSGVLRRTPSGNVGYAKALLAATAADQLVDPPKPETKPEQIAKLENEMPATERDFAMVEESYSRDTLNLQLACAYLKTLLRNARVARHLGQHHGELLAQLEKVVEVTSLEA